MPGYCDNPACELHSGKDAPGPIEIIRESRIVRVSRYQMKTQAGVAVNLCYVCYGAVRLFVVDKKPG
jgi:hypothetical protein